MTYILIVLSMLTITAMALLSLYMIGSTIADRPRRTYRRR